MHGFPDLDQVRSEMAAPYPSGRMSPSQLGDTLAQLVWESFSDFVADAEYRPLLLRLGIPLEDGLPPERIAEELLILHLWAHSRAVQLSLFRRVPEADARSTLDHLHGAVFEDMVKNGTPEAQLPVFEQRVSARYTEYYAAAEQSDQRVGEVALEHLVEAGAAEPGQGAARLLTERAIEIANPLRDFVSGVELVEA
jgi:hypothetical protein